MYEHNALGYKSSWPYVWQRSEAVELAVIRCPAIVLIKLGISY